MSDTAAGLAAGVLVAAAAACGGASAPAASPTSAREWIANAGVLIDQLQHDVLLSTTGGANLLSARKALHDDSIVVSMLVAYTDFGSCDQTLANVGAPSTRVLHRVQQTLGTACKRLQKAAVLFTQATTRSDPRALLAASRAALAAAPILYDAKAQLAAARG